MTVCPHDVPLSDLLRRGILRGTGQERRCFEHRGRSLSRYIYSSFVPTRLMSVEEELSSLNPNCRNVGKIY